MNESFLPLIKIGYTYVSVNLTVLQDGLPLGAIDLLAANEVAGGVGKVDEAGLSVEVQGPGVHEGVLGARPISAHASSREEACTKMLCVGVK